MEPKELLTAPEVARMLGMTEGAFRNAICRGQAPARIPEPIRLEGGPGGRRALRWAREDVERWIDEKRDEAGVSPRRRPGRPRKQPPADGSLDGRGGGGAEEKRLLTPPEVAQMLGMSEGGSGWRCPGAMRPAALRSRSGWAARSGGSARTWSAGLQKSATKRVASLPCRAVVRGVRASVDRWQPGMVVDAP